MTMDQEYSKSDQPGNPDEKAKKKRSRWIKWILNIIDSIVTALT